MSKTIRLEDIDKNFSTVSLPIDISELEFYDVCEEPFELFGLIKPSGADDRFRRIPKEVAESVSDGVLHLHCNTSGGRVRFRTSSKYIVICAKMENIGRMSHFTLSGSAGFDIYNTKGYLHTFVPDYDMKDGYTSCCVVPAAEMSDYTIYFPLYSDVISLSVGIEKNARLEKCESRYRNTAPVVYYGSSITQGGCASRSGNAYQSIISRELNLDYINLGFSGSAKAEDEMTEYISQLEMSLFVYDYDHNAPNSEYLKKTHKRMFDSIRKEHPDLPIIIISKPIFTLTEEEEKRLAVIKNTYNSAIEAGDENVYFISGYEMINKYSTDEWTVDGVHPNDEGLCAMARCIGETIKNIPNLK